MTATPPWGHHLILDVAGCDTNVVRDAGRLDAWVRNLVQTIGMEAYGDPRIVHFGQGELAGMTVMQLITTSNINAHFMDGSGDGYIDCFSCRPFDVDVVLAQVKRWLRPEVYEGQLLERRAGQRPVAVWSGGGDRVYFTPAGPRGAVSGGDF